MAGPCPTTGDEGAWVRSHDGQREHQTRTPSATANVAKAGVSRSWLRRPRDRTARRAIVPGPIPRTRCRASMSAYGPAAIRSETIAAARAGPRPGRASSAAALAWLMSIGSPTTNNSSMV